MHEDHVEVAGVGELGPAEAADADHREGDRGLECGERRLEGGLGQRGQVVAHLVDRRRGPAGRVPRCRAGCAAATGAAPAADRPSRARHRGRGRRPTSSSRAAVGEARRVGKAADEVGVVGEDLAEQAAGTGEACTGAGPLSGSRGRSRPVRLRAGRSAGCAASSSPRSGSGAGEPVEQQREQLLHQPARAVEAPGQLLDRGLRAQGVDEAEGREAGGRRLGAQGGVLASARRTPRAAAGSRRARGSSGPSPGSGAAPSRAARRPAREGVPEAHHPGQPVERDGIGGRVCTCCSSTSWSRCSTVRRRR